MGGHITLQTPVYLTIVRPSDIINLDEMRLIMGCLLKIFKLLFIPQSSGLPAS
jgi:putative effector of murein hydrolase LrgA (UPF0299 family)